MHKIYELKDRLCDELESFGAKENLDISDLEFIDTLAHSIKNIDKIIEVYEECNDDPGNGSYMYETSRMQYPRSIMSRTGSYSRRRMRNSNRGGGYSYDNSYRYYRSNRNYSRAEEEMDSMVNELKDMMQDLPTEKQHEVQRFIDRIEQM